MAALTFENVRTVGLALPNVEATTKYDGSPVLKVGGSFMAGLATHPSAEPETLVVRVDLAEVTNTPPNCSRRPPPGVVLASAPGGLHACNIETGVLQEDCD